MDHVKVWTRGPHSPRPCANEKPPGGIRSKSQNTKRPVCERGQANATFFSRHSEGWKRGDCPQVAVFRGIRNRVAEHGTQVWRSDTAFGGPAAVAKFKHWIFIANLVGSNVTGVGDSGDAETNPFG